LRELLANATTGLCHHRRVLKPTNDDVIDNNISSSNNEEIAVKSEQTPIKSNASEIAVKSKKSKKGKVVCPYCNQTKKNLEEHMLAKHKEEINLANASKEINVGPTVVIPFKNAMDYVGDIDDMSHKHEDDPINMHATANVSTNPVTTTNNVKLYIEETILPIKYVVAVLTGVIICHRLIVVEAISTDDIDSQQLSSVSFHDICNNFKADEQFENTHDDPLRSLLSMLSYIEISMKLAVDAPALEIYGQGSFLDYILQNHVYTTLEASLRSTQILDKLFKRHADEDNKHNNQSLDEEESAIFFASLHCILDGLLNDYSSLTSTDTNAAYTPMSIITHLYNNIFQAIDNELLAKKLKSDFLTHLINAFYCDSELEEKMERFYHHLVPGEVQSNQQPMTATASNITLEFIQNSVSRRL
jgi:hypothetical protein